MVYMEAWGMPCIQDLGHKSSHAYLCCSLKAESYTFLTIAPQQLIDMSSRAIIHTTIPSEGLNSANLAP